MNFIARVVTMGLEFTMGIGSAIAQLRAFLNARFQRPLPPYEGSQADASGEQLKLEIILI